MTLGTMFFFITNSFSTTKLFLYIICTYFFKQNIYNDINYEYNKFFYTIFLVIFN